MIIAFQFTYVENQVKLHSKSSECVELNSANGQIGVRYPLIGRTFVSKSLLFFSKM